MTVDHCDIVDLSRAGWNTAAIVKDNPGNQFTTITLTVNNSSVYSQHNKAVNMILVNNDSFQSDYNNMFGTGTVKKGRPVILEKKEIFARSRYPRLRLSPVYPVYHQS